MTRPIVIATDFSESALKALVLAANLARRSSRPLIVAHVAEQHHYPEELEKEPLSVEDARYKKWVDRHLKQLAELPALNQVDWTLQVASGKVMTELDRICQESDAELLVIGNKGRIAEADLAMGSTAIKAVRNSRVPVLTVDKDSRALDCERILFISDFRTEGLPAFHRTLPFLRSVGKEMHLLKVITPMNFESTRVTLMQMDQFAKKAELVKWQDHHFNSRSLDMGIAEFLEVNPMDLVVMETHGRKGLGHYFHGSHAESLVEQSPVPVLTMRIDSMEGQQDPQENPREYMQL